MRLRTGSLAAFLLLLCLCGSSQEFIKPGQVEIDAYVQAHPELPELDKTCIYEGRFQIGMLKETVEFLLGKPRKIEPLKQEWAMQEVWHYRKGGKRVFYMEKGYVVGIE